MLLSQRPGVPGFPSQAQWESGGVFTLARNACTEAFDALHRAVTAVKLLTLTSLEMMPALRARLPRTKENSLTCASPADTIHLMYWLLRGKMRDKTSTANTNCKNGLSHHCSRPKANKMTQKPESRWGISVAIIVSSHKPNRKVQTC